MKSELALKLEVAEATAERLATELVTLRARIGAGEFVPPTIADRPAADDDDDNLVSALWSEIASLRTSIERLQFENRLIWERVLNGPAMEEPPTAVAEKYSSQRAAALEALETEGLEAALRHVDVIASRAGSRSTVVILRELAEQLLARQTPPDQESALALAKRAHATRPDLETATLLRRAADVTGDIAAHVKASEYIARNSGARENFSRDVEQLWKNKGKASLFLRGIDGRPSGIPYERPIFGRVLMSLHSSLPMHRSGYAYRSHSLLKALAASGCDVTCYTRLGYPRDLKAFRSGGAEPETRSSDVVDGITYCRIFGSPNLHRSRVPLDSYLKTYAEALQLVIRQKRINIVHTASNYTNAVAGCMAARDANRPFIHEVRGFWELSGAARNSDDAVVPHASHEAKLEVDAARHADRVVTLNEFMKEELVRRGIDADRIVIVPNGIEPGDFFPMRKDGALAAELGLTEAPTIGYVGSFAPYEGLDDLVRAFSILKARGVRFNGLLVGDGESLEEVQHLVDTLGLQDTVRLTGRVPQDQARRYYSLMDITPFPRKPARVCELVTPIKPFEAMAMGKVILVSSVGALAAIVKDGHTGFVFDKGSIESLTNQLEMMIGNPDMCERVGARGRSWVLSHHTWKDSARILDDLYHEVSSEWAARRIGR